MIVNRQIPRALAPLEVPSRYKGVWGGRGSGKSHNRAEALIEYALESPGLRAVCIREVQKTLKESAKRLIEDKLSAFGLNETHGFKVFKEVVETPGDGLIIFQGMRDHTADSIKSLEGYKIAWVEEAQTLTENSLKLLRPTIRAQDSELWFTWNPRRKTDPIEGLLRREVLPEGAIVVKANWYDNPMFPSVLEAERRDCLANNPEEYDHIWEGGYATHNQGAYYAKHLLQARQDGRIGVIPKDPLLKYHLFFDIGGTGINADAFTCWVAQIAGKEIRILDYYEVIGQELSAHVNWMRKGGYETHNSQLWLPHDGANNDKVYNTSYQSALQRIGYAVDVVPNQGSGAAMLRVEAGRRMFGACFFDRVKTEAGREALGAYHEKRDVTRNIGLGPHHDWSSHGADSFGLMCVVAETLFTKPRKEPVHYYHTGGWQG